MTVSTVQTLTDQAQALLAIAADALALTTEGTPDVVFQSPAPPADDCCPALVVYVAGLSEEATAPFGTIAHGRRTAYGRINLATYVIRVMRCAANPDNMGRVDQAATELVAAQVNEDGWVLWNAIRWAVQDETFKDTCSIVHWGASRVERELGGCVGWQFIVSAEIDGIPNP